VTDVPLTTILVNNNALLIIPAELVEGKSIHVNNGGVLIITVEDGLEPGDIPGVRERIASIAAAVKVEDARVEDARVEDAK
jgi:hypothetical protein